MVNSVCSVLCNRYSQYMSTYAYVSNCFLTLSATRSSHYDKMTDILLETFPHIAGHNSIDDAKVNPNI